MKKVKVLRTDKPRKGKAPHRLHNPPTGSTIEGCAPTGDVGRGASGNTIFLVEDGDTPLDVIQAVSRRTTLKADKA